MKGFFFKSVGVPGGSLELGKGNPGWVPSFKVCTVMMTMGTSMGVIPLNCMVQFSPSYVGTCSTVSARQPQFLKTTDCFSWFSLIRVKNHAPFIFFFLIL